VSLAINGGTTLYLYGNGGELAQEISPAGVHLLSGMGTSRLDTSGVMSFLSDDGGSVIGLTDSSGNLQTQYSYDPLGAVAVSGAASTNPYQFEGMQNDGTGAYYASGGYYRPDYGIGIGGGALQGGASPRAAQPGNGSCDKCKAVLLSKSVFYLLFPNRLIIGCQRMKLIV
jgi:hypothetical protein